jgi:hypothetical protein
MFAQITTIIGEVALICEVALGAALVLLWAAIEVIGYGGIALAFMRRQQWVTFTWRARPARDIKWGSTVRAAGLRRIRVAN